MRLSLMILWLCWGPPVSAHGGGNESPVGPRAKLGAHDIIQGIKAIRAEVGKCGLNKYVAIKFSIEGSTGTVISATPLDEHAATPVGECVARAAKKAKFPEFQADQQSFTFKFRLPDVAASDE
jgi:hypothetical protein